MIKVIVFIKKRADITTEQFRHHYETVHAPMVDVLLPYYATYRRNYVDGSARIGGPDFAYDVVSPFESDYSGREQPSAYAPSDR